MERGKNYGQVRSPAPIVMKAIDTFQDALTPEQRASLTYIWELKSASESWKPASPEEFAEGLQDGDLRAADAHLLDGKGNSFVLHMSSFFTSVSVSLSSNPAVLRVLHVFDDVVDNCRPFWKSYRT